MVRISVDYDLMYSLARDIWSLRDKLLDTSRANHDFAPSDIGPRKQTSEALTDYYGAWKHSFEDAWEAMTELGNLLDQMGKAFFDQDAQGAGSARAQAASMLGADLKHQQEAYRQQQVARAQQVKGEQLKHEYALGQAVLDRRQAELDKKQAALNEEREGLNERQDALNKRFDALQQKQDLLLKRVKEGGDQGDLRSQANALQSQWDDLQKEQDGLSKEEAANDAAQDRLDKEWEPLRRQDEQLRSDFARDQEALQKDQSTDIDPGLARRYANLAGAPGDAPPEAPTGFVRDTPDGGRAEVSYKLDANGQIALDKNGNPVETTTTITSKEGMVHSETFHELPGDGNSVTTIHSADGSVTKVYEDAHPAHLDKGWMERYVTDGTGAPLQMWQKAPNGDWGLVWQRDDSPEGQADVANGVGRPPAYLTVENPIVDSGGHPVDTASTPGTTTQLPDNATRTDFTRPDGSVLKVVTAPDIRYVADGNNEIQEIWRKSQSGGWYLDDSVTQHTRFGDEPPLGTLGVNWR